METTVVKADDHGRVLIRGARKGAKYLVTAARGGWLVGWLPCHPTSMFPAKSNHPLGPGNCAQPTCKNFMTLPKPGEVHGSALDGICLRRIFVERRSEEGSLRPLDVAAILCVLGVLGFLGWLLAGHVQAQSLRTQCQGNLRQMGLALQLYAQDYHGLLPDCTPANATLAGPQWPWDLHTNLANILAAHGLARPAFYCPANPTMNDDRHWNFWRANPGVVRVVGYGMLFRGVGQVPPNLWRAKLNGEGASQPAQTELMFDATACVDDDYQRIQGLWVDRSNHMQDQRPLGGNLLFEDQHVDWREFSQMQPRFRTIGPGGWVDWSY